MSYDVHVHCTECGYDLMEGRSNYTSNVSRIWTEAGVVVADLNGQKANAVLPQLQRAIERLRDWPAEYEQFAPENGWGDVKGAREFLERIRDAACKQPNATIDVSH